MERGNPKGSEIATGFALAMTTRGAGISARTQILTDSSVEHS
jgi:hypothetical protein